MSAPENKMDQAHPLDRLFAVIKSRQGADPATSYTAKLFSQGTLKIAKKLGEEGVETALAAVAQDKTCLAAESADLLYHLLVLWAACGLAPEDAYKALEARANRSGIEEKASR
jgi:phosphoribosyl-ATP pyrophosphohydrolase